jgi:aminopeptidase N
MVSEMMGETKINSYAFPNQIEGAKLALESSIGALESFSERLGPYPYTEFDIVSTPMLALGMEYPGIIAITLRAYDPDAEISGMPSRVMLESVVAHEVAHQWFYNTVGNDQVDEPWLDEALVQYMTGRYYVDRYGQEAVQGYLASWDARWERVDRAKIPIGLPAAAYVDNEYGAIVYGRGPIFVATLAEEMGEETFNGFLRDYYRSHRWDIGTGDAFRQLAEDHCQCDLGDLFAEWVYEK